MAINLLMRRTQTQKGILKLSQNSNQKPEEQKETKDKEQDHKTLDKSNLISIGNFFFNRATEPIKSKEPLGNSYEDRKKIIFGKININDNEQYISQMLLNSQKKINAEYVQVTSNSSFFFDVPQKVYNLILSEKENIANFFLIIHLYLLQNNFEKAKEIYLLFCKQNLKIIHHFFKKIILYCKRASPAMLRYIPSISKIYIQILSCLIKFSGKFSKSTFENEFTLLYLKTIYLLTVRDMQPIDSLSIKNDLNSNRLYIYSSCIFDSAIFTFYRYQPLIFSIYLLQHIINLYTDKNVKEFTKYEQLLLLKVHFNLGMFLFVNGNNNESITNLINAKNFLSEFVFNPPHTNSTNDLYAKTKDNKDRNSTNLSNLDRNLLSKIKFYRQRLKSFDDKKVNEFVLSNLKKKKLTNKVVNSISQENNNNNMFPFIKRRPGRNSTTIYLGTKNDLSQPLLFKTIKLTITLEINLLLIKIEIIKKNYKAALDYVNYIINPKKLSESVNKAKLARIKSLSGVQKPYQSLQSSKNVSAFEKDEVMDSLEIPEKYRIYIMALLEIIDQEVMKNLDMNGKSNIIDNKIFSKDEPNKIMNYTNFKVMEKFFIFICGLSIFQLNILNISQPKKNSRNDLPIIFTNQFKDCLTHAQRLELTQLETMNLTRYIILINPNDEISPENLDYKYMKHKIKTNEEDKTNLDFKSLINYKIKNPKSKNTFESSLFSIGSNFPNKNYIKKNTYTLDKNEETNQIINSLMSKIDNEESKQFVKKLEKKIVNIFNGLSKDEKNMIQNSPELLIKILKKMDKTPKKKKRNISEDNSNSFYLELA